MVEGRIGVPWQEAGLDPSFAFNRKAELMNLYKLPSNSQAK